MNTIPVIISGVGPVQLVDREQLRFRAHGRQASIPYHLKAFAATPTPPATFDWAKGESIKFPISGNDQYGDCYYVAVVNMARSWLGMNGKPDTFDVQKLIARYLQISRGDNGLSDSQILPEWRAGIIGPNGPHKILDEMTINPNDDGATVLCMWLFGGLVYTCSLPSDWANNARPGVTWDRPQGRSVGGHAMIMTGKNSKGGYDLRTWGVSPPINLTPAGIKNSDPELITAFSLDMFNSQGYAPNGLHYDALAKFWTELGGKTLPPSPFGPPVPVGPPVAPNCIRLNASLRAGTYENFTLGSDMTAGDYVMLLAGDQDPPPVVP